MRVSFYGTSAAVPSASRGFACIGIQSGAHSLLLDCGDGTIRKLVERKVDVTTISEILITHCHSDHLSGITSVVETMAIRKKSSKLTICGPVGLKEYFSVVQKITGVAYTKKFEIEVIELAPGDRLGLREFDVTAYAMDHTVTCLGYRVQCEGKVLAYTGDTQPCKELDSLARTADLIIHEATFLHSEQAKARESKHSTPKEAAEAANNAHGSKLIMTHVNEEHEKPEQMVLEATPVFKNSFVAFDGLELDL